jgi:hydroxyethylthiazole kinase
MAASVLGAFNAVEKDSLKASACALACYNIAGEIAAKKAKTPMKFKAELLDSLYYLSAKDLKKAKIGECK